MNAGVLALHVIDAHRERSQMADLSGAIGIDASAELTEELVRLEEAQGRVAQTQGRAILQDAERLLREGGVTQITTTQRHGSLVETLGEFEGQADLVVMGKRGKGADFAKGHLGSNLERVIRSLDRPVLVAARAMNEVRSFVLAYDGGPSALKAVDYLVTQPLLRGLTAHLVMAGRSDECQQRQLEESQATLQAAGYEATTTFTPGTPEDVIAAAVKTKGADLLVMGAYGHSTIRQFFVGSTTAAMVRTCLIPILMFR
jgi:nucleotide-binding universal stress UspA family protein